MTVRILGIRHHSPACARLVQRWIQRQRPAAVLIEGPADFNARIGELLLPHRLPVALYSYANQVQPPAQCWFPFLAYSPEWVALRAAHEQGALLRFIDLPHWRYRARAAQPATAGSLARDDAGRSRYARAVASLCERMGCDGDNALWDTLFEDTLDDAVLLQRLDLYFDELRGDDPGTPEDQSREAAMARWIAWAAQSVAGDVLVICGGWHKRALEQTWPALAAAEATIAEPVETPPDDARSAGSYLVPYAWRQVEALGGYGAGMQSPRYYQWVWDEGPRVAGERALGAIVERLRAKQVVLSTADLVAWRQTQAGLTRLRGRTEALRVDLLDALQATVVKEALDAPAPWASQGVLRVQHHPVLREALLALTGEGAGVLAPGTPLPPLLHDVQQQLAACGLQAGPMPQTIVCDRRQAADQARSERLWQLRILQVQGARLEGTRAPVAARGLPEALRYEEHWSLQQDDRWHPDLIEAAAWGATLEGAARQRLGDAIQAAEADFAAITQCLLQAVRAGLGDLGQGLAARIAATIPQAHDVGALARAARVLLEVVQAGFWGTDTRPVLEGSLAALAARLQVLLEDRQATSGAALEADVAAVSALDRMLRLRVAGATGDDRAALLDTLARLARSPFTPPGLRGAALGAAYEHEGLGADSHAQLLAVVRAVPPRDALGDFLYGLFACARELATRGDAIPAAMHEALQAMSSEDFLVALPQLRAAFTWFPPRERGLIAQRVGRLLGLAPREQAALTHLRGGTDALLDARRVEAQALAWAREIGL